MHALKEEAAAVAAELKRLADNGFNGDPSRDLPPEIRQRFIAVRDWMITRGVYDPVLIRLDSATAPKAMLQEIAEQLGRIAEGL